MLQPRTILITGASSGIGEALARHYAASDTTLALNGRDEPRLAGVVHACQAKGARVEHACVDVTDRDGMRRWIEAVDDASPIDLVIANAGISAGMGNGRESEQAARRVLATNVDGVLNTVFPLLERMGTRRKGQIALVSSLAAYRGLPTAVSYSASKAAVRSLAESWRLSLAPDGIRVSVICPGFVTTRMTARNSFAMPFLMSAERAAAIIAAGLVRDKPRIAFPWPMAAASWLMGALPPRLSDAMVRRLAPVKR